MKAILNLNIEIREGLCRGCLSGERGSDQCQKTADSFDRGTDITRIRFCRKGEYVKCGLKQILSEIMK